MQGCENDPNILSLKAAEKYAVAKQSKLPKKKIMKRF